MIDSIYRTSTSFYPRLFSEECKYVVKEKNIPEYITDDIDISSDENNFDYLDEKSKIDENSD